jgi:polar amino acid transport system substrate-binding protein
MKKPWIGMLSIAISLIIGMGSANGADRDLAKTSHIRIILQRGELRVGFETGHMPFAMTNKRGEFEGFDIDFGRRLAKDMGVKFVPVNTASEGLIPALVANRIDIVMGRMTITQKRNLKVAFADPYIVVGQAVLLNKKHKGTVKSYETLNNPKYIITSRMGSMGEKSIKRMIPKAVYKRFETETDAGMAVINGKADALVYDQPFIGVFFANHGKDKTVFLERPFTYEPLAWAINQGDPDFLNFLNNFLLQCKGDGFYENAFKKWMLSLDWRK